MKKLFLMLVCVSVMGCEAWYTDKEGARKVLQANDYKVLEIGGYDAWSMSSDETYSTKFKAVAPGGKVVTGCVTRRSFGGSTIRLY